MAEDNSIKINKNNKFITIKICHIQNNEQFNDAIKCFEDNFDNFDCPSTILAFYNEDPKSFFIAIEYETNKIIGICCVPIIIPNQTHFLGLYGVHYKYRSLGIGTKLFEKCLNYVKNNNNEKNIGLFAVPDMIDKYVKKYGFNIKEDVSMITYKGKLIKLFNNNNLNFKHDDNYQIIHLNNNNYDQYLEKIIKYDEKILNISRENLIKFILEKQNSTYYTCLILNNHDIIQGYGCIRKHSITKNFYLGPIYADNVNVVELLIKSLIMNLFDNFSKNNLNNDTLIIWNTIDSNKLSLNLIENQFAGLEFYGKCERIFTKHVIFNINYQYVYAIFSPDFSV